MSAVKFCLYFVLYSKDSRQKCNGTWHLMRTIPPKFIIFAGNALSQALWTGAYGLTDWDGDIQDGLSCGQDKIMDTRFFLDMLSADSTSGKEGEFADIMAGRLSGPGRKVVTSEVGDGTKNVLVSWGDPKVFFCTHLDTVPPYIAPSCAPGPDGNLLFRGRGTCDAKGQIAAMYQACLELEARGLDGFALLLLAGEETGSYGAKAFSAGHPGGDWVIVGEPTDNCMVSASKGTKAFEVTFSGKAFHSGYPEYGTSAVMMFNRFVNALGAVRFPEDPVLGKTTWNIGRLVSDNPQNILSDRLTCRIYFRTTFASDAMAGEAMEGAASEVMSAFPSSHDGDVAVHVKALGGDVPSRYETFPGFETKTVAFGSDAPHLKKFRHKILCGPGSILVAHTADENILSDEIEKGALNYVRMFLHISSLHEEKA